MIATTTVAVWLRSVGLLKLQWWQWVCDAPRPQKKISEKPLDFILGLAVFVHRQNGPIRCIEIGFSIHIDRQYSDARTKARTTIWQP